MAKNINRDYIAKIDVKTGKVTSSAMTFCNTDKGTSNIYVQLIIKDSPFNYSTIEDVTDYNVNVTIIKPNKSVKTLNGDLISVNDMYLFEFNLPDDCVNLSGNYNLEFTISDNKGDSITSSPSRYTVSKSILTDFDPSIEDSDDYPILKKLIDDVNAIQINDEKLVTTNTYAGLNTADKTIVGAINEVNSKAGTGGSSGSGDVDLSAYQTKTDNSLVTTNKTITGAINELRNGKVDKVSGKGLSTNDYTTTEKNKLANIDNNANNYSLPTATSSTLGGVKVGSGLSINNGVLSVTASSTADTIDWSNITNKPTIPTVTNDLTDELKSNYDTAYTHSQSTHAPIDAQKNIQSDWNVVSTDSDAYIKNKPTIPTKTSELTNDSSFATETFVTNKIAEASLSGGDVDLSGYQEKTDNSLNTTSKSVTGAINELNGKILSITYDETTGDLKIE